MEERFNSLSILKKSILWVILENKKGSILRVILKKRLQLFESYWEEVHKKRFNSMSPLKRVTFFESVFFLTHGSILWVICFNSLRSFLCVIWFNSLSQKNAKKKGWNLFIFKKIQFFASYSKKFNSSSHIWRKVQFFDSLRRIVQRQKRVQFNSLRRIQRTKKGCNSLRRIWKKSWILWLIFKKNQLFESWKNNSLSNFQWVILENTNSLTDTKQKFNSLSHIWRKVQFFES